ncbi:MAG: hypothetical protein IJE19_10155 [Clostridia bacterium]|nr:hypothetical protein [Clostridia bacterium]
MKNTLKKIMSIVLALISCFMLCSISFADEAESSSDSVYLVDAKIVKVPLKNRISFKQSPKSPEGIKIELTYSDGTIVTEEVVINGDRYYVNGELLEEAGGTTEVIYGITSAGYFMNEGNLFLSYKYLALPSLVELFKVIFRVM